VVPRRREPERARQLSPAPLFDDADAISDSVLRGIYKASRKRSLA